ncbi:MAG TPA: hypothetical protein DEB40_09280 [Elusimicrobia bacterium]|nr:hypothetical protein [Elusimicrobiota bacterium]HBT61921.1 hypothetical protein [Elusimicrobiota bacterium]
MMQRFMSALAPQPSDLVLDLGASNLSDPMENIFENSYPYKHKIIAAGTEDCSFLEQKYPGLRFVRTKSGEKLPFSDNFFSIGFCNAVIEHVGSSREQRFFLSELLRVSRRVFLATPNRWFPVELHTRIPFLHWLPQRLFRSLLRRLRLEFYADERNLNLLTPRQLRALVPPGSYRKVSLSYHYFLGLPSNLVLIIEKQPPA